LAKTAVWPFPFGKKTRLGLGIGKKCLHPLGLVLLQGQYREKQQTPRTETGQAVLPTFGEALGLAKFSKL
jgi:hypothetical protein